MQRLVKVGLLRSVRGPRGGFTLAREPAEVTLLEVYEAIEGPVERATCVFGLPTCDGSNCILGCVLVEANQALLDHLSRTRLTDIRSVFLDPRFQIPPVIDEDESVN
jgi:Rrf2 family protein